MPVLPVKWRKILYRWYMLAGRKDVISDNNMKDPVSPIYNISAVTNEGKEIKLDIYKGKKMLIVNVASECGFTPQYKQLQELYENFKDQLVVLAFPSNEFGAQEPGTDEEIRRFCVENYQVTFPLFSKIKVTGKEKHPLYKWLSDPTLNGWNSKEPGWNFCKYVVDENGKLLNYLSQTVDPFDDAIINVLKT